MNFITLQEQSQLEEIKSSDTPSIIFKHNTTCPISKGVKRRLEEEGNQLPTDVPVYIVDLLSHRNISDAVAADFSVQHESPQLLVIRDGKCSYHKAMGGISVEETAEAMQD